MSHLGFSWSDSAACVKTVSPGRRLTRPAPARTANWLAADKPLRLLLMLPASLLIESESLNFLGGKKSRLVNVDDLRSKWLQDVLANHNASLSNEFGNLRAGQNRQLVIRRHKG